MDDWLEAAYEERYEEPDMEAIPSGEVFPNVELSVGKAPKHTAEDHEACAYYPDDDAQMLCVHEVEAAGGFYSEDYVLALKQSVHKLIGFIDANVETKVVNWSNNARIERKYMHAADISDFRDLVENLRELTK